MILSLRAAYEHCIELMGYNDMCTNNPRYDFTCYRCIFNGAVHRQRSAKEVWLTVFPMSTYSIDKSSNECYV